MFNKFFAGYRLVFTFGLVAPESPAVASVASNGAPVVPIAPPAPVVTVESFLQSSKYRWRKIATIARKTGKAVAIVNAELIGMGCKISRDGLRVKVGSARTTVPVASTVTTAPPVTSGNGWDSIGGETDADDAEDDDYNEDEDGDEDSELDEESEDEDCSDLDESEFDESKMTILRNMLDDSRFQWRKLPSLAQSADLTESEARDYLAELGARESRRGGLFRN